jgi:hypothetical protein
VQKQVSSVLEEVQNSFEVKSGAEKSAGGHRNGDSRDGDLIRFYDDRAIQMVPNEGKSVRRAANAKGDAPQQS